MQCNQLERAATVIRRKIMKVQIYFENELVYTNNRISAKNAEKVYSELLRKYNLRANDMWKLKMFRSW